MENIMLLLNERIDTAVVNSEQYTVSLLSEALKYGLVTNEFYNLFQMQLLNLFEEQIGKYTAGSSSSVAMDKGKEIIQSILFITDMYLKAFGKPSSSLEILKSQNLKEIYNKGFINMLNMLSKPKKRLKELQKAMLPFQNESYVFTIKQEIPEYLKNYNILFNAHQSPVFMYPLAVDTPAKAGIYGVNRYIVNLYMENKICSLFSQKDIINLLKAYNKMYNVDYSEMILNLFDIVMKNAIFAAACSSTPQNLVLIKEHGETIHKKLLGLDEQGISGFIDDAVERLIHVLKIEGIAEQEYINRYKKTLLPRLLYVYTELKGRDVRLQNQDFRRGTWDFDNYMDIILFYDESLKENDCIVLNKGKRLSNKAFSRLVENVDTADTSEEKAEIIKESIQSIYDFMDILGSACLSENDCRVLFKSMGDIEAAAICLRIFETEIKSGYFEFSEINTSLLDEEWERLFSEYVKELPEARRVLLMELISKLRLG